MKNKYRIGHVIAKALLSFTLACGMPIFHSSLMQLWRSATRSQLPINCLSKIEISKVSIALNFAANSILATPTSTLLSFFPAQISRRVLSSMGENTFWN